MGIAPIPGIGGVGPANAPMVEREVQPALALGRCDRMQEDAYKGSHESAERGMEEEDSESIEDLNADATSSISRNPNTRVNFFA